jgi:DNA-binding IclR family transcriptional regulator
LKKLLDIEIRATAEMTHTTPTAVTRDLEVLLEEIRGQGISRSSGSLTPGINGFSAPVFDHTGRMVAAITSLGTIGHFDMAWDSPLAHSIKEAAATLSKRLGYGQAERSGE